MKQVPDEGSPAEARRRNTTVGLVLGVTMLSTPSVVLRAQSAAAQRVAAVLPASSSESTNEPPRVRRGLPPECVPWVAWGVGIGAAAGLAWAINDIAHTPSHTRPIMVALSPFLAMIPTFAGGAIGGLTGYIACAIRYAGSTPPQDRPLLVH